MKYLFYFLLGISCLLGIFEIKGAIFYKESIVVGDTPVGVSSTAKDPELKSAFITVEGGNVRFWLDGSSPTSSVGHLLIEGDSVLIQGINAISNSLFIRTGSTTTTLRISYDK